ncbi:hypothetical protein P170DRAFT_358697 [Aspergillus steynii IBT 23096]|uniref:Aromatic prenyltransferase n=1 Tax=Aspergillus steynii IBT 23096 TaxID=1392250 RepID=A0A2I2GA95_9EURO|nr:uncharacterized protein P170DRAFT_358697 [Aspergillus steynii IBT 23096]PLB49800.1 hypothetical protein P170DRAFT_358697 [Aspergillus steynii IBT 23096]
MPHYTESVFRPETATEFSSSRFLSDLESLAKEVNSSIDKPAVENVLTKFDKYFQEGCVVFRSKDRPNDTLNYRLFLFNAHDTMKAAIEAGLLDPSHPFIPLMGLWHFLCHQDQTPAFWPDFSATKATIAKTWLLISPLCSIKTLLRAPGIPNGMQDQFDTLQSAGLDKVRFIAADYDAMTVNFYWPLAEPLSRKQADQLAALGGSPPPSEDKLQEMKKYLDPRGTLFAVTMKYPTGEMTRVGFYALNVHLTPTLKDFPQVNERGTKFLTSVKSHDKVPTTVVSWSFGRDGGEYTKLEAGNSGEFEDLILHVGAMP